MNFLPIVHRELRIAARKRGTYISRAVVAGLVILLWLVLSATTGRYMNAAELARTLFWTYGILALLYALLCGVFFTADALSAERREGTLGLLFLTDLRGFDVVLGKLVATSWHGVYSLLVIVPVLALPMLMGGVSYTEMGRLLAVILSTVFYTLSVGLLVSTLCRRMVAVVTLTFLILFVQCAAPWVIVWLLDELTGFAAGHNPLVFICPLTSMSCLQDMEYQRSLASGFRYQGAMLFWVPIIFMWVLGAGALGFACWWLPRVWRRDEQPVLVPVTYPSNRPQWNGENPYASLAIRDRKFSRLLVGVLLAFTGIWGVFLGLSFVNSAEDLGFSVAFFGAFALHVMAKGWLALEASRRFCEDRQSGAMELLLVTPVRVEEVINGEVAAIKRAFAWPLVMMSGVNVALALVIAVFDPIRLSNDRWWFVEVVVLGGIILWLDARATVYTGMLAGLRSKRHHLAVLGTVLRVLVPPWLGVVFFFLFIVLPGGLSKEGLLASMHGWFFLSALLNFILIVHAKSMLRDYFRPLCAGDVPAHRPDENPAPASTARDWT